jgi:hypothetical protein
VEQYNAALCTLLLDLTSESECTLVQRIPRLEKFEKNQSQCLLYRKDSIIYNNNRNKSKMKITYNSISMYQFFDM